MRRREHLAVALTMLVVLVVVMVIVEQMTGFKLLVACYIVCIGMARNLGRCVALLFFILLVSYEPVKMWIFDEVALL